MKISQEAVTDAYVIKSYGDGFLLIQSSNHSPQKITQNCIITPDGVSEIPEPKEWFDRISESHLTYLQSFQADVIIFVHEDGLSPSLVKMTHKLAQYNMALEIMSLGAACRTYNLLLNEGRRPIVLISFSN